MKFPTKESSISRRPLVSSIIIFLNGEDFIPETIESILAQTYESWELLLVDDGSTDGSSAIAKSYAEQYPQQIRYLEHEGHDNKGMSASRNLGISHARGDFIGFLDADDLWVPQKLEEQLEIFEQHPEVGMVYGRTQIWHSWNPQAAPKQKDYFYTLGVTPNSVVHPPVLLKQLLDNKHQSPTTCNALIRRSVFEKYGSFEAAFRTMYEDQVFFSKVTLNVPAYVDDRCWAKYRQHPQSCSSQEQGAIHRAARQRFLLWLKGYLEEQQAQGGSIEQLVNHELRKCKYPYLSWPLDRIRKYRERGRHLLSLLGVVPPTPALPNR